MGGFQLLVSIGFGYLLVSRFQDNLLLIFIEVLLVIGVLLNYVFYRYFKKIYTNIDK